MFGHQFRTYLQTVLHPACVVLSVIPGEMGSFTEKHVEVQLDNLTIRLGNPNPSFHQSDEIQLQALVATQLQDLYHFVRSEFV